MDETQALTKLIKADRRFSLESYRFISEVFDCAAALSMERGSASASLREELGEEFDPERIAARELCRIAVAYAVQQYGYMARTVLAQLGIHSTNDIGEIVYNLASVGLTSVSPDDSLEDFDNLFDLGYELESAFKFQYERKRR